MASRTILIINFENPGIDVEVVDDQASECQFELILIGDVIGAHGNRNVADLEDSLSTRLSCVDNIACCQIWFTAHNRRAQLNRQLYVKRTNLAWHDVRLLPLDQLLYLDQRLG